MNAQIREQAAQWLIEFRTDEPDAKARQAFATWLRESPQHVGAYLKLAAAWEDAAQLGSHPDVDSLIELARADTSTIVAFEDGSLPQPRGETERRGWPHPRSVVALAAAVGACAIAAAWWYVTSAPIYSTALGEQRTLALPDGSTVELNARSKIRVGFKPDERQVTLIEGQALFNVVHNAARPFVVVSGDTRVRDVGTQFDVARFGSGTTVTVVEGAVSVSAPELVPLSPSSSLTLPPVLELAAGEQVTVAPHSAPRPHKANVASATAWTQQQLVFESTPLPEAAEQFNRFNTRQLRIEGAELATFHVSGTFAARDPASLSRFVLFLRTQPGIEVQESAEEILVRAK